MEQDGEQALQYIGKILAHMPQAYILLRQFLHITIESVTSSYKAHGPNQAFSTILPGISVRYRIVGDQKCLFLLFSCMAHWLL